MISVRVPYLHIYHCGTMRRASLGRIAALLTTLLCAVPCCVAAAAFGQEDDITVLTLTRLATGVESTTSLFVPELVQAMA
jgi:hypothetical protein